MRNIYSNKVDVLACRSLACNRHRMGFLMCINQRMWPWEPFSTLHGVWATLITDNHISPLRGGWSSAGLAKSILQRELTTSQAPTPLSTSLKCLLFISFTARFSLHHNIKMFRECKHRLTHITIILFSGWVLTGFVDQQVIVVAHSWLLLLITYLYHGVLIVIWFVMLY